MRWLKRVIAQLLGTTMPPSDNHVPPTPIVGLANKEPITQVGNKRSVEASTKLPKVAPKKPNSKRKVVQSTTPESSRKAEPKSARKTHGASGKQQVTFVRQTPLHAKLAPKRKP